MDSAKILRWLSGQDQPDDQDQNDIRSLNEEYPYWPVVQWLYARYVKKDEGQSAAHYKTDPIQFARFFTPKSASVFPEADQQMVPELEVLKSEQLDDTKEDDPLAVRSAPEETKQEEIIESGSLEPELGIQAVEEQEKMPVQSPDSEIETMVDGEKLLQNEPGFQTHLEEHSEQSIEIQDNSHSKESLERAQDDILALIHDLPNSIPANEELQNLMPQVEIKSEETNSEPDVNDEDQEEDKSLMVMMSFTDWLHYFKNKRKQEQEEEDGKRALRTAWQKEKLTAAIEEETDAIPEPIFKQAMESISADSGVISESLALVLAKQGKFDKAIEMYRKLSLRNPQKNTYFAGLIQELRLKQNG